jgi:hypothetical protein
MVQSGSAWPGRWVLQLKATGNDLQRAQAEQPVAVGRQVGSWQWTLRFARATNDTPGKELTGTLPDL